jgi:hypothetical protein
MLKRLEMFEGERYETVLPAYPCCSQVPVFSGFGIPITVRVWSFVLLVLFAELKLFWGLAPRPPLGSERRSPNPFRKGLRLGSMERFALASIRVSTSRIRSF